MDQDESNKREKSRKVYSTAIINKMIEDRQMGYEIDYEPFFNRDIQLRAADITFMMTPEEVEEYQRCYDDPEYFISKYCVFMTDKGLSTVELRPFQKKMIHIVTEEVYDDELDDFVPKNRNVIWLASRQCSKCVSGQETVNCKKSSCGESENVSVFDLYNKSKENSNVIDKIKTYLYKIYKKL